LLAFTCSAQVVNAQTNPAAKGIIDLRHWDFDTRGTVSLSGEWELFISELASPQSFRRHRAPSQEFINFPSTWNALTKSRKPGEGFATYHAKIIITPPRQLSLELPHFYSNYTLWINGAKIASNGKVGTAKETSEPQWLPQTIPFMVTTDTLDVVIHVSNFHHNKGGIREQILLGKRDDLAFKRQVAVSSTLVMSTALVVIALVFIFLYFFSRSESSQLYVAALCITWALRSLFSNLYVFNSFFPDFPWELCVKIEYITLYLMMIWSILYLSSIFRNEVNTAFKYLFCLCNMMFIILTLFFDASLYTQFLPVYLSFCAAVLIYSIYVLIRALVYERKGVWLMIASLFLCVMLFSYDLVSYQGFAVFNPIVINVGYLSIFVLLSLCLLYHLGYLKKNSAQTRNTLSYEDLYGHDSTKT
jgi:hypothetical protein